MPREYDDPLAEVAVAGEQFVPALATVLTFWARAGAQRQAEDRPQHRQNAHFYSVRAPTISISDYLRRIATYFECSPECFVICLVYIDRLVRANPDFMITELNVHRLLVTSAMLAAKFFDDYYYNNSYYARVGGISSVREMNELEIRFMRLINYRLHVTPEDYERYREYVNRAMDGDHIPLPMALQQQGEGQGREIDNGDAEMAVDVG